MKNYFKYFVAIVFTLVSVFLAKAKVETTDHGKSTSHQVAQPAETSSSHQLGNTTQYYNNSVVLFRPVQNLPTAITP